MQSQHSLIPAILESLEIPSLNAMQTAALQADEQHREILLLADTGSGKTLAFLLPLLPQLQNATKRTTALIIAPSRELALQIEAVFKKMKLGLKVTCCYGGHKVEIEENNLLEPPALLIGTPGRLADHIRRGNITTHTIETLILDEFDKLLELGFQDEISFITQSLPSVQKKWLVSATSLSHLPEFLNIKQPHTLHFLSNDAPAPEKLSIQTFQSTDKDKLEALLQLLCMANNRSAIVFCNHRDAVERTGQWLKEQGLPCVHYHGSMEQRDREAALCKFANGTVNVLVTTDLASRGLDIQNIRFIIHYHLPATEAVFTHRNGRTARMHASGTVILITGPEESLPAFITPEPEILTLNQTYPIPEKSKWATVFIAAGKKDKVNKVDIVGFLTQKAMLKKEDIGIINVKDFYSFVAIRKSKASHALHLITNEKIKGKKVKIAIAK